MIADEMKIKYIGLLFAVYSSPFTVNCFPHLLFTVYCLLFTVFTLHSSLLTLQSLPFTAFIVLAYQTKKSYNLLEWFPSFLIFW